MPMPTTRTKFSQGQDGMSLRHSFAVALLADEGVSFEELETLVSGGSITGFSVLRCETSEQFRP